MSKSPVLGYVKTRMQPHLRQEESLNLHIALVQYCLQQWQMVDDFSIHLWIAGDVDKFRSDILLPMQDSFFKHCYLHSQPESDLGERMLFAVNSRFKEHDGGVFLVGTDCPFINKDYLSLATAALDNNDVVLGPATDGGYVLLAMKTPHAALFIDISWGSSSVLAQTQSIIQKERLQCVLLPPLPDIDEACDLKHLHGCEVFADYQCLS